MSWTASLGDAQIGALATAASADNLVTYLEMLGLLEAAAGDGISAVEFADLQTVHANFAPLYGSDYIRSISTSVIVGNPGNAKFWGGAKALGDVAELGNMAAGLSAQKAGWLIDKWFLGRDLPMPVVGGDTANSKAASGIYSYAKATGALFVSGAAASDINQGSAGTCYLVASLGAIAGVNGALITDAVIDNANGSYGVRFYLDGAPVYVTVDQNVPVTGTNRVALSSNVEHSLSGESWVSLIEKAYAQLNAQANINNAGKWSGEASYQAVEGGWANPIKQLTNLSYRYYSSYYAGVPDNFKASEVTSTDAGTYKQTIIDGLAGGAIGWLASFGNTYDAGNSKQNLVSGHAFMLLGYDAGTDLFTVRNPWGGTGGGYNAQFTVTIGDFWNSTVKGIVALSEAGAAPPVFSYALASSAGEATPATEGDTVTLTITRSGTGAASTVYLSTTGISAGAGDFAGVNRVAVNFAAQETTASIAVKTNADTLAEDTESFRADIFVTAAETVSAASVVSHIKDQATAVFSYAATSSAPDADHAAIEGAGITYTITRSGSGSVSTIYLSTMAVTAGGADIAGLDRLTLQFAAYETVKSITIATLQDSAVEGTESFNLEFRENPDSAGTTMLAAGFIADAALPAYGYTIQSSAGSAEAAVEEGGAVSFSIHRSGTGTQSTVYVATGQGSAGNADYAALALQAVTFEAYQSVATVTVQTNQDWWLETPEYFRLDLFLQQGAASFATHGTGFIKDRPNADFNYAITNSSDAAPVAEGSSIVFTVTRSGSGAASTVYLTTTDGSAGRLDYAGLDQFALEFAAYETSKQVTIETLADAGSEEAEHFWLNLYRNIADSAQATSSQGRIADAAAPSFDYSVTSSAPEAAPVDEGGQISFTITRSGTGAASTVYVSTLDSTAGGGTDFAPVTELAVDFAAHESTKTVTVATYADASTEGDEYFWLDLYETYADSQTGAYAAFARGTIADAVVTDFSYTVSSDAGFATPASEGGSVTFTITRSGTGAASTVYVTTIQATAWENIDYTGLPIVALAFAANETAKTITVHTLADEESEVAEKFWLDLYTSLGDIAGGDFLTFGTANIVDPFSAFGVQNAPPAAPANSAPLTATDVAITSFRGDRPGSFANTRAFAAIRSDRSVVTWGDAENGGDSSAVSGQLAGVVRITPNAFAFAALRADGSVVTWGNASLGGNSAPVAGALAGALAGAIDVTDVFSTMSAFAAVRRDGSVITWGDPSTGGNSASVAPSLDGTVDVTAIVSNMSAFAALRADGSVVAWGYGAFGGDSTAVAAAIDGTLDVMRLAATGSAFAAIRSDGSVVTWGNAADGGDSSAVAAALNGAIDVVGIGATASAFAAIRADGSVVTWGQNQAGGSSATVAAALDGTTGVVALAATQSAFAARREDGSVVAWGSAGSGGDLTGVAAQLDGTVDAVKILANSSAFAALRSDGSVVVWGHGPYGGDAAAVAGQLTNVVSLAATEQAFAALRADGSVVTWGSFLGGGNSADVAAQLDGTIDVVQLTGTGLAFAALRADGSVVTWGDQVQGGFSGAVASALTSVSQLTAGSNTTATADLAIAAADAVKLEGGAGATTSFTFTVTRTGNTGTAITVPYTVSPAAPRPAGAAAFSGGVLPSGTVAFAASETNATITIEVAGDAVLEGNQNFTVTLGPAPAGVAFVAATATGTILEDEAISDIIAVNGSTGNPMAIAPVFYAGPVAGLEREMILLTPENLTIALAGPNWFVHSGSGDDAIAAFGGTNVLDGGTGSNFLTGGPGADTFFVDARGATAPIWSTVNGFSTGDAATLWGVSKSSFDLNWFDGQGAPGFTNAQRTGGGLTVLFGHDPGSDSDYMYVLAN